MISRLSCDVSLARLDDFQRRAAEHRRLDKEPKGDSRGFGLGGIGVAIRRIPGRPGARGRISVADGSPAGRFGLAARWIFRRRAVVKDDMFDGKEIEPARLIALDLQRRLTRLDAERALAVLVEGLAGDRAYVADLNDEIAVTSRAYTIVAVTEIATLRAELSGPQLG
jgi:hypothetical protein